MLTSLYNTSDDQAAALVTMANYTEKFNVTLDYSAKIFLMTYGDVYNYIFKDKLSSDGITYLYSNSLTNSTPALLHMNGGKIYKLFSFMQNAGFYKDDSKYPVPNLSDSKLKSFFNLHPGNSIVNYEQFCAEDFNLSRLSVQRPYPIISSAEKAGYVSMMPVEGLGMATLASSPLKRKFGSELSVESVRAYNDISRSAIKSWIRKSDYDSAIFSYGLAVEHISEVDKDVGGVAIIHDVVSFLALSLENSSSKNIIYLEIGVSVGKCLYTQINIFPPTASVFAVSRGKTIIVPCALL